MNEYQTSPLQYPERSWDPVLDQKRIKVSDEKEESYADAVRFRLDKIFDDLHYEKTDVSNVVFIMPEDAHLLPLFQRILHQKLVDYAQDNGAPFSVSLSSLMLTNPAFAAKGEDLVTHELRHALGDTEMSLDRLSGYVGVNIRAKSGSQGRIITVDGDYVGCDMSAEAVVDRVVGQAEHVQELSYPDRTELWSLLSGVLYGKDKADLVKVYFNQDIAAYEAAKVKVKEEFENFANVFDDLS